MKKYEYAVLIALATSLIFNLDSFSVIFNKGKVRGIGGGYFDGFPNKPVTRLEISGYARFTTSKNPDDIGVFVKVDAYPDKTCYGAIGFEENGRAMDLKLGQPCKVITFDSENKKATVELNQMIFELSEFDAKFKIKTNSHEGYLTSDYYPNR